MVDCEQCWRPSLKSMAIDIWKDRQKKAKSRYFGKIKRDLDLRKIGKIEIRNRQFDLPSPTWEGKRTTQNDDWLQYRPRHYNGWRMIPYYAMVGVRSAMKGVLCIIRQCSTLLCLSTMVRMHTNHCHRVRWLRLNLLLILVLPCLLVPCLNKQIMCISPGTRCRQHRLMF